MGLVWRRRWCLLCIVVLGMMMTFLSAPVNSMGKIKLPGHGNKVTIDVNDVAPLNSKGKITQTESGDTDHAEPGEGDAVVATPEGVHLIKGSKNGGPPGIVKKNGKSKGRTRYGGSDDRKRAGYFNEVPGGKFWYQLTDQAVVASRPQLIRAEATPPATSRNGFVILVAAKNAMSTSSLTIIATIKEAMLAIGSMTDLNVLVYCNWDGKKEDSHRLNEHDEATIIKLGVRVHYIDYEPVREILDMDTATFGQNVQWFKLWMLLLPDYEKVLFFDYDVLPLAHMDDYWHFPTPLFYEAEGAPTNGGFLLMQPSVAMFDRYLHYIALDIHAKQHKYHRFPDLGWGRKITEIDFPQDLHLRDHVGFNFVAGFYDQGLFAHMCFFEYEFCYIAVHRNTFDQPNRNSWHCGRRDVLKVSNGTVYDHGNPSLEELPPFYTNFVHFWGGHGSKPWDVCSEWKRKKSTNWVPPRVDSGRCCEGMTEIYKKYCGVLHVAQQKLQWAMNRRSTIADKPATYSESLRHPSWVSVQKGGVGYEDMAITVEEARQREKEREIDWLGEM